jgi:xylulokinase
VQGETCGISFGTAAAITYQVSQPVLDPQTRIPLFPYVEPRQWLLEGVVSAAGASLRWLRDLLAPASGDQGYEALSQQAGRIAPGSEGVHFYPHLSGAASPLWQSKARGTFLGLGLSTQVGHLFRATLEGTAYQIRHNVEVLRELGCAIGQCVLFGGGARGGLLREVLANVLGLPLTSYPQLEAALAGAYAFAAKGLGWASSFWEAAARCRGLAHHTVPDRALMGQYEALYQMYRVKEEVLLANA